MNAHASGQVKVGPPHRTAMAVGVLWMNHLILPWIAAVIFALAVLHTFCTKYFEHLAHTHPRHAGIWHLLGEVEVCLLYTSDAADE